MQIKNRKNAMTPVLRLVKQYAPNTYEAMESAYWPVTLVADDSDFDEIAGKLPRNMLHEMARDFNHALGVTCMPCEGRPDVPFSGTLDYTTWLHFDNLQDEAASEGIDPVKLAATVLVHEWTHRRGYGEEEAYIAAAKFARKMGEERIARGQEAKLRNHQAKEAQAEIPRQIEEFEEFINSIIGMRV